MNEATHTSEHERRTTPPVSPELLARLERSIQSVIRGKDEVIRLALVTLFARGHLLIEDVPGVGKTTLAQSLARSFSCTFQRLQFTSDMLPSDVDNHTHSLPQPFMVIATQNPVEHHGTYPLPESQLDRFLMRLRIGYPSGESEREILRNFSDSEPLEEIRPVAAGEQVVEIQQAVRHVTVDDDLVSYALAIVVEPARAALYPILEALALVEPINVASDTVDTFFERLAAQDGGFNVIFTSAPRTSIPAALGHCSHITFIDSLS